MEDKKFVKEIQSKEEDYSRWYLDIVKKADLMDYGPVKGTMVIKPYGYAIWENMQKELDSRIKETGHDNAYFPLLIPESYLQKEMSHVEGFAPEVAWVTQGGNEPLEERLVVRPTSETIICSMMSQWIQSYRDLPMKLNQWANVMRWEKSTKPFLRTSEFLWQEGHTAHSTNEEAEEEALTMLEVYRSFVEEVLAMPVIVGKKTENEKFAGADHTYSIEALMSDGKALQAGTSHNLGQNFSKVFEIQFSDQNNTLQYVYQTSWGSSTRMIGGLIMTHSDDRGLALPPRVAPIQVVIVPILRGDKEGVKIKAQEIAQQLKQQGVRVKVDDREEYTPGWKFNEYEMRGVPIRIELGPKDMEKGQFVLARRDTGEKEFLPLANIVETIKIKLDQIQEDMFNKAKAFMETHTFEVNSIEEMKEQLLKEKGFMQSWWCEDIACLDKIKEETGATARNIPFKQREGSGKCVCCGKESTTTVMFARAY
ncbi:proline--tRNA ligase [Tepidibacillus decaturensis]|uniref:Proline--tRNA ligase n=1 Tax=Tepidibacillus decaturensis TaxID=1413211 RepID=A0A135L520_9BACI|nr:proline--tRNA ligase [Tepidibacillus decaturensis]KXG44030.1 proline--tRNA ligase [Tepidibacillus decaturensis]